MSSEEQPKTAAEPVGQQLRRARERLGLNLSAIADQQHLRTSVIQAIEDGDFSKVDTELFLKGYVRAYAQQVGLNADTIINDLDAELEPLRKERERQYEADPLVDIERKKKRKRRLARAVVVLLFLGAVGFGLSVYLADGTRRLPGFSADPVSETSDSMAGTDANNAEPSEDDLLSSVAGPAASDTELPSEPEVEGVDAEGSEVMVSSVQIEEGDAVSQLPETVSAEVPEVPEVAEVVEPELPETVEAESLPGSEVVTESAPMADDVADSSSALRMSFNDDCWVQVTDAEGNRLASTLQTRGDVLEVSGEAPLSIVIGAMSALDILEFQGEPVDLNSIRTVNNRAEFTLEP